MCPFAALSAHASGLVPMDLVGVTDDLQQSNPSLRVPHLHRQPTVLAGALPERSGGLVNPAFNRDQFSTNGHELSAVLAEVTGARLSQASGCSAIHRR